MKTVVLLLAFTGACEDSYNRRYDSAHRDAGSYKAEMPDGNLQNEIEYHPHDVWYDEELHEDLCTNAERRQVLDEVTWCQATKNWHPSYCLYRAVHKFCHKVPAQCWIGPTISSPDSGWGTCR